MSKVPFQLKEIAAATSQTFTFNWSTFWLAEGATIVTSEWDVPDGVSKDDEAISDDDLQTSITLTCAEPNKIYRCKNRIVDSNGDEETLTVDFASF